MNAPIKSPKKAIADSSISASPNEQADFEKESQMRSPSIIAEFVDFLIHNKKWWLTPIVAILLILSFFILLTNTAVGPFIYVLF